MLLARVQDLKPRFKIGVQGQQGKGYRFKFMGMCEITKTASLASTPSRKVFQCRTLFQNGLAVKLVAYVTAWAVTRGKTSWPNATPRRDELPREPHTAPISGQIDQSAVRIRSRRHVYGSRCQS